MSSSFHAVQAGEWHKIGSIHSLTIVIFLSLTTYFCYHAVRT